MVNHFVVMVDRKKLCVQPLSLQKDRREIILFSITPVVKIAANWSEKKSDLNSYKGNRLKFG